MEPLLRSDPEGELSATTTLEWLDERHLGRFGSSRLRTLQRRIRGYRAFHDPDPEVYFQQDHPPGREAQVDSTHYRRQPQGTRERDRRSEETERTGERRVMTGTRRFIAITAVILLAAIAPL